MGERTSDGSLRRTLGLAAASGVLYAAAQPPLALAPLAFVALVPLLIAASTPWARIRLLAGAVTGTVAGIGCVGVSVFEAARLYFDQPPWIAALCSLLVPLVYGTPFFALFAHLAGKTCERDAHGVRTMLLVPTTWVATELARANVGHGTPWCLLAHSQSGTPSLLQTASLGGAFAVSYLLALVNAGVLVLVRTLRGELRAKVGFACVTAALAAWASALVYGRAEVDRWSQPDGASLRVAVVQPDVPAAWRASLARVPAILERLTDLTQQAAHLSPDFVVWPENAVGFVATANDLALRQMQSALADRTLLILGAPRSEAAPEGHNSFRNAALLVDAEARLLAHQDKRRLTPFAEQWPRWLPRGKDTSDPYLPGESVELLPVHGHPVGVLICPEAIYPELARDLVRAGAEALVNISNDAWFGASAAPLHHLNAVRLRAVELRRWLVRSTNTGLSAIVAPTGEIVAELPPEEPGVTTAEIHALTEHTPYARFGDAFALLCVAAVLTDLVWQGVRLR